MEQIGAIRWPRRYGAFAILLVVVLFVLLFVRIADAKQPNACTTIQSGSLVGSDGYPLVLGYNQFDYNYQAHMFNGWWCNYHPYYRYGGGGHQWCVDNLSDTTLMMGWNEAWLSNKDCDSDGLLDRHYGYPTYIGSGAWLTNHERGSYVSSDGESCSYEYFVKIIAAPADAYKDGSLWRRSDGTPIGEVIWGDFAVIQEVNNDPCAGSHGKERLFSRPGLGNW